MVRACPRQSTVPIDRDRRRPARARRSCVVRLLTCALVWGSTTARAEIAFQTREDLAVGSNPTAMTLLGGVPATFLVANASGLAAFRYVDGVLQPGPRRADARGAALVVTGPLGPGGAATVAWGSREAARIAVAPVDARGAIGTPELIDLPALPRAARIAAASGGAPAVLFVAHDDGVSAITRGATGWQRRELSAPSFVSDLAVGDVDGDGRADVVVPDERTNQLVVLRGTADGGFTAGPRVNTVRAPSRIVLADVDGDHRLDLLVIGDPGLVVHSGLANGGFGEPRIVQSGDHLSDVVAADVNADGRIDLAVLDRSRSTLSFLLGGDGGRFSPGDSYLVGYGAEAALVADLDGDGKIDALALNQLGDNATLLHGLGGGRFDGIVCLRAELGDLTAIAVDDFDRDEHPDIAVASEPGGRIALYLGRGDGRFQAQPPISVGRQPRALVAGDFDQDGSPDLAVVNFGGDTVAILRGDGHGGFATPQLVPVGSGPSAIGTGSFGSDTSIDLAVVNSLSDSVSILYGDGRGQFPNVATFPVTAKPNFLIVGDTNQDGHQDLVVGNQFSESVAILLGNGKQLAAPTTSTLKGTARPSLAEDFDGDGQMDLVNPDESASVVEILPGTAPGEFATRVRLFVGRDPYAVATGDFNRDGKTDIAVVHRATQTIAILLNRSTAPKTPVRGGRHAGTGSTERGS
jgi:hypothetical protein